MHTADPFVLHHEKPRMAPAAAVSLTTHAILIGALLALRLVAPQSIADSTPHEVLNRDIVWLSDPGIGGGGGGGGNRSPLPPRAAVMRGADAMTIPAQKPPSLEPQPTPSEPPPPQPEISAKPFASGADAMPGVINALPGLSQGPGTGGGAGTGQDGGVGPGRGNGLGPGRDSGFGGGVPGPGNGVLTPTLLRDVRPSYTTDAMRARIQGSVLVECIVGVDGSVTDARVLRSLDPVFGLDQEAVKTARQWKFRPGTFHGEPVPVRITIELIFTLR